MYTYGCHVLTHQNTRIHHFTPLLRGNRSSTGRGRRCWILNRASTGKLFEASNIYLYTYRYIQMYTIYGIYQSIFQTGPGWWLTYPSEKYKSQLEWLFPMYGKIKFMFQTTNQGQSIFSKYTIASIQVRWISRKHGFGHVWAKPLEFHLNEGWNIDALKYM